MNTLNFDPSTVTNYPLSIDRMGDLQHNLSAAADILTNLQPHQACILSGCEARGAAGYVRLPRQLFYNDISWAMISDFEIFEVVADQNSLTNPDYLDLVEESVAVVNSQSATVTVATKRYLVWATSNTANQTKARWSELARLYLRSNRPNTTWRNCTTQQTFDQASDQLPRVCYQGGQMLIEATVQVQSFDATKPLFTLPQGYKCSHDILVPVCTILTDGTITKINMGVLCPLPSSGVSLSGSDLWVDILPSASPMIRIDVAIEV